MKGIVPSVFVAILFASVSVLAAAPGAPSDSNPYGGAVDEGGPSLELAAALLQAGGGADKFSMRTVLVNMLGTAGADDEITRLERRYGAGPVREWLRGSDWLVLEGVTQLRNTGMDLPAPSSELTGTKLAAALVDAGVAPGDTTFWTGYYYDHLFSHAVNRVMETGMDRRFSEYYAKGVFMINNQAMYDISQSMHGQNVQLAALH